MKWLMLFNLMGMIYYLLEVAWRGYSHWSMWILGGVCGILIGLINEYKHDIGLFKQVSIGLGVILPLEFITGCIVNIWLGLNVWDYSELPFNLYGQVSLTFAPVFIPCIFLAILLDDFYRWKFNNEPFPRLRW